MVTMKKEKTQLGEETFAIVDGKQDIEWWNDENELKDFCAKQLGRGCLVLVLGAGVSVPLGLPDWPALMKNAFSKKGARVPSGKTKSPDLAKRLYSLCDKDEADFADTIRKALYKNFKISQQALATKPLLNALGAMTMPSIRGNVKDVVTFNFDDLLETYLRYFGFVSQSISRIPFWGIRSDVRVYHPHGLLPSDLTLPIEGRIIMAQIQYEGKAEFVGELYEKLYDVFRSNTCLFIGLKGEDPNFTSLLKKTYETHISCCEPNRAKYWGIRFSDSRNDSLRKDWDDRGVCQHTLRNYNLLPEWLFDVCQRASRRITNSFDH